VVRAFEDDQQRVLVTTQITYIDSAGEETLYDHYDPVAMASDDPITRFTELLHLLTEGFALLDPLYATMRRGLAVLPRRNMLREDEVFAARLALAGPWGHVPLPLARRHRPTVSAVEVAQLLDVPAWQRRTMDLLQCKELLTRVETAPLDRRQRLEAYAQIAAMYGRRKYNKFPRGLARLRRMMRRPPSASSE
jgi:hypothetical protein